MDGLIAYALSKKYVDQKTGSITTGMSWKGTKENVNDLPQSGSQIGDLWHVNENGNEYAWDGSKWEALGGLDKSFTETDPTVPDWAKQPQKPAYTAAEVGALPSSTFIPSKVSDLQNDSGYLTSVPVQSVNDKTGAVVLNASDVGALPATTPIPAAVTEQTVAEWGFTKNTGTYSKPSSGIPDSDIASAATWNAKGTYSKPSGGIPASDLAYGVIPTVPEMATNTGTSDWTSGKVVDAAVLKTVVYNAMSQIGGKADASSVYTKTEVDQKLVGAMDYKGTKDTVSALPTSGNETGDVWHITADGSEWAWNGSTWEELGTAVDLSGYRTASAQDAIDTAQDSAIAAKYTKPSGGIPKSDLAAAVQTSLGKADSAYQKPSGGITTSDLNLVDLESWLDNVGAIIYTLSLSGTTVTLNESFLTVYSSLADSARQNRFILPIGSTAQNPVMLILSLQKADAQNYTITLACVYNGNRYSVTLSAASVNASPMTGTLVTTPLQELPDTTSASANDFLCLNAQKQPIWKTVPAAESNSFGVVRNG